LHIFDAHYEERDEADVNDLRLMRYGISLKEGVLPISLQELIEKAKNNRRPNELTLGQLRDTLEQQKGKEMLRKRTILRTELSKRFSNALVVVTFVLVGIPLAITAQRRETFTYFIFVVLTDTMKGKANFHPEILIWLPNVVYLTLGSVLFYRLAKR
jgi:lipopolysaccharide export system permease protein